MDDNNTSNTPDNASRPGNRNPRPRHPNGKFMTNAEIAERDRQHQIEAAQAMDRVTVGEFRDAVDKFMESDPTLGAVSRSTERKPTRIGQHARRTKAKKTEKVDYGEAARSLRFYQIRNIPGMRKFGLFYADGVPLNEAGLSGNASTKGQLLQHWLGAGGYEAQSPNAALHFDSAAEAKSFRQKHFKLTSGFLEIQKHYEEKNEVMRVRDREFRRMGMARKYPSHTTSKKNVHMKKQRKVRDDLVKLYSLIGRTH